MQRLFDIYVISALYGKIYHRSCTKQALNQWSRSYQNLHNFQLFHGTEIDALKVLRKHFGQARLQNEAED